MAKIEDMPAELLENIFLLARHSVLQCIRVCRIFNAMATPVLYREIKLESNPRSLHYRLHTLLRTIIDWPNLGKCTRYLSFVYDDDGDDDDCPFPDLHPVFASASRSMPLELQKAVNDGSPDGLFFLLLSYLPALRMLHIDGMCDYIITPQILGSHPLPSGLQSVKCISFKSIHKCLPVLPFLTLPALDTFTFESGTLDIYAGDLLPHSSKVKHIKLLYSDVSNDILKQLACSSQSLQTFVYYPLRSEDDAFHAPSLGNALRGFALPTLAHLELEFFHGSDNLPTHSLGPLCDFEQLTHITASLSCLLDYPPKGGTSTIARQLIETLPKSLLSLHLVLDLHWMKRYPTVVEELLEIRRTRLLTLKTLTVCWDVEEGMRDRIQSKCAAEGVRLRWG